MSLQRYYWLTNFVLLIAIAGILIFGTFTLFILVYIALFLVLLARFMLPRGHKLVKLWLFIALGFFLTCQIVLAEQLLLIPGADGGRTPIDSTLQSYWPRRIICTFIIILPLAVSRYIVVSKYARIYLPSVRETGTIAFAEVQGVVSKAKQFAEKAGSTRNSLSPANLREVIGDSIKHDSFNYVNKGSLTESYFDKVNETMADLNLYIVISRTGSAASSMIAIVTGKNYNHASLSFDRDLQTIVSYNSGNNVYPPGMNPEMLADLTKKNDASILVYSLKCTAEQKANVLQRIREINESGSAYNVLGLWTKRSYRQNIMFCSQFVYQMLKLEGLSYFDKDGGDVEPSDFIELDYHRVLSFEYEVSL
ncbi:MAG: hypothetical protein FWD38_09245 [Oscillospiraceae bacterium]|nr:hypothetical protein [Oscillospiraceae bacterium]